MNISTNLNMIASHCVKCDCVINLTFLQNKRMWNIHKVIQCKHFHYGVYLRKFDCAHMHFARASESNNMFTTIRMEVRTHRLFKYFILGSNVNVSFEEMRIRHVRTSFFIIHFIESVIVKCCVFRKVRFYNIFLKYH